MRNLVTLTMLVVLAASLEAAPASAAGAVAIGVAPGGVARGYATGFRIRAPNLDTAKAEALAQCKKPQVNVSGTPADNGSLAAQANCKIVMTFVGTCYSSAVDPKDATPGAGWAVADTQQQADAEALARCRSTAGADRASFCQILNRGCDSQ
jgi:hypothetical protein